MKRRLTVLLLTAVFFALYFFKGKTAAEAAEVIVDTNLTVVLGDDDSRMYQVSVENGDLKIRVRYYHNSKATLSYHTEYLYFTAYDTGGNPAGASRYYVFDVPTYRTPLPGNEYEIFTVPAATIRAWAEELCGMSAKDGELVIYMSQGFVLKRRSGVSANWNYDKSPVYNTLNGILGAADWSAETKHNFSFYFDVPLRLNLNRYNLTVDAGTGGIAYGTGVYEAGEQVSVNAAADEGYFFDKWSGGGADIDGADWSRSSVVFTMPARDVALTANFGKGPEALITQKPVATPAPEPTGKPGTGPTPSPVPTTVPMPTPEPPYIPSEDGFIYKNHVRYYTTDAGYTMEGIYNSNGYLAGLSGVEGNGRIASCSYTALDTAYSVGTDDDGNTWYFLASGTKAYYVHPKVYKGYCADTSEVRYIKELTFPEKIRNNGVSYTVTSIGGGTGRYSTKDDFGYYYDNLYTGGTFGITEGNYSYAMNSSYNNGSSYSHDEDMSEYIGYIYGVIGNGAIISNAFRHFHWADFGVNRYEYEDYRNEYHVYNTTLEWITIPDTVTEIASYAFYNCQALRKISGAGKVISVREYAFAGADHLTPLLCGNGPKYSFSYYYYNGSYSFDVPTAVMLDWEKNAALSEYMELAEFPELKTIGSGAFLWHTNLFDVKLPAGLSVIRENAFAGCNLNSINIPGKDTMIREGKSYSDKDGNEYETGGGSTLGTRGTPDTVIYTVPESQAMFYGLRYTGYYTLRCGYEVTYRSNAEPEETYTSVSMLRTIWKTAVQSQGDSGKDVYYIDEDGGLWRNGTPFSTQIAKGIKFKEFVTMDILRWTGSAYEDGRRVFAVAENGAVWLCEEDGLNLNMPVGAYSFQWSGNGYEVWLYYLDAEGCICCARISESGNVKHERILHDYPLGGNCRFESIVIENEGEPYPGAVKPVYYNGTEYPYGCPPQITAGTADGRLVRYTGYPMSASYSNLAGCYMPPAVIAEDCGGFMWIYKKDKEAVGDGSLFYSNGYDLCYLDRSQNLCRVWYDESGKCYKSERIAAGNFTGADSGVSSTFSLLNGEDGTYVLNQRSRKAELLFTGTAVKETRTVSGFYFDYGYGYSRTCYYDVLYVLDDTGRLFSVYDLPQENRYGKTLLVSGVKKAEAYGNGMLVLDENGDLWTVGTNSYGALPSYRAYDTDAYSYEGAALLWKAEKITSSVKYTDVYMDKRGYYSLVRDTAGNVYAAGYGRDIFGDDQKRVSYVKVSVRIEPETQAKVFLAGYEFAETFYASMFTRDGYGFLYWNTEADGSGTTYYPGNTALLTAPLEVYAQWERDCSKIRYAPNGGSGMMEDDVYELTVARAVLKPNAYTKKGHEFNGWNTKADGTGVFYRDEAVIALRPGVTVLYAQWEPFSYVLKVAEDEVSVTPVTITGIFRLEYDEETSIPEALPDKFRTVSYSLNKKSGMSTAPYWKTATPLPDMYTKAILEFRGWQLYEETSGGYRYLGFYEAGETVKNLAERKNCELLLFPYWGGDASYVKLPAAGCSGYDFIGWSGNPDETAEENIIHAEEGSGAQYKPVKDITLYAYYEPKRYDVNLVAEEARIHRQASVTMTFDCMAPDVIVPESDRCVFLGYFTEPEGKGEQYYDREGSGLKVWRTYDGSISVLYAYMISKTEVTLDGRGATKQEQTGVVMTYGETGPDVVPPEKTGYTFLGYFTEIRGGGIKYFDADGKGSRVWLETNTDILYAYWKQNPVELPEEEKNESEVLPETDYIIEAEKDGCVQIYADDYNPDTGPADDLPPYQVSDVYSGTEVVTEGAIPSTECVAMRARMGSYLFSAVLSRKSGITQVRTYVTVRYKTVYEDAETEELIVSGSKKATFEVMVPKSWSYWELKEGEMYYPSSVTVSNKALKDEKVELSVNWEGYEIKKPSYTYVSYDEHTAWSEYDTDGVPVRSLTAPEEYVIVSGTPGESPDAMKYLTVIAENLAWADKEEFTVKNDRVCVGDVVVLSDTVQKKDSVPPADNITERLKESIPFTSYEQTYASGIRLFGESKNQSYESSAFCVYEADFYVTGEKKTKTKKAEVNAVNIHTPVVCDILFEAAHENKYQCKEIPEAGAVLVLSEAGIYSDFTVQILNEGYHSDRKGYGVRSYTQYLAEKEGKARNEIRFPFEVWIDSGNDNDNNNDVLLKEGTWYTLGTQKQRFYVPVWVQEGEYKIEMRSVAVNAGDDEEKAEAGRNVQKKNYTATAEQSVYITGRLYDFTIYDIRGNAAWEDVREQKLFYPTAMLPLRAGVHPYYRNAGGLPVGGSFSFRVKSIGSFYGEDAVLTLIPEFELVAKEGRKAADVYYEKETSRGVFLEKWDGEKQTLRQSREKGGNNAVQYWYGTFTLPDALYAAESGSDVLGYQERYGLDFSEDFWIKGEALMLRFSIRIENGAGEVLYYGKLPEYIKNDIWCQEQENRVCIDSRGKQYFIEGGDTAVIYFEESAAGDYSVHGIY